MSNVLPRFSEGNKVEFFDKVSIWLNRAAGFFSKDTKPTTPADFAAAQREYALLLTWTPAPTADFYNLYVSSANDVNSKLLVGRLYGDVSSFLHYIGVVGTRYYWLEACTNTGRVGELVQSFGTSTGLSGAVPTGHRVSHEDGGSDEISVTGLSGVLADNQHAIAHHTTHESGGSDEIKLDDLKAPDDNTDLNASDSRHGLLPKLDNNSAHFLDGQGNWSTPSGGGGGSSLIPPVPADFSWLNQGSASLSTADDRMYVSGPSNGTAQSIHAQVKAIPTAPYKIDITFYPLLYFTQYSQVCVGWRQSSDGKIVVFNIYTEGDEIKVNVLRFSDATTFNTSLIGSRADSLPFQPCIVRLEDDNSNRIISYSGDGNNFVPFYSEGRTSYLTASQSLFGINPYSQFSGITVAGWFEH